MKLLNFYKKLLDKFGYQGWWPINNKYHPKDYDYPKTQKQVFEICIGALLTQNTSWLNASKALNNLIINDLLNPDKLLRNDFKHLIRPAGYYNQKFEYIKNFSKFFKNLNGRTPKRKELLSVKGVGFETADSILLYAYKIPTFVVDAYTRRVFNLKNESYNEIKEIFESELPKDYELFQEYHALIVEYAKKK